MEGEAERADFNSRLALLFMRELERLELDSGSTGVDRSGVTYDLEPYPE